MIKDVIFIGGNVHSGNTFLCHILRNNTNSIVFDGEGRFYENKKTGFKNINQLKKFILNEYNRLNGSYKNKIKLDLKNLNINKFNLNFGKEFLKLIIKSLNKKKTLNIYIQKATSVIMFQNQISRYNNNIKFIFLLRNPFNIYGSIKKREEAKSRQISIFRFLIKYYYVLRKVNINDKKIKIIKYENLVLNFQDEIKSIEKFTGYKLNKISKIPIINTSEFAYKKKNNYGLLKNKAKLDISNLNLDEIFLIILCEKIFGKNYYKKKRLPKINLISFLFFMVKELIILIKYPPLKIFEKVFN